MNDEARSASDTLLRLVRFAAGACDARYAFVVARSQAEAGREARGLTCWLARDWGLHTELGALHAPEGLAAPSTPASCALALRQLWPGEPELAALTTTAHCLTVPLLDEGGRLMGQLGILDPGPERLYGHDRLAPLGRLAWSQLAIWIRQPSS
jgi:hypothetical protein